MIRIIAGKYRGIKLIQPNLDVVRPTMDRIKEAIFSSIQFDIKDSLFLDLYSGSGSIAFEAISRGAMKVIAVDNSFDAISCIKDNQNKLGITNISIIKSSVIPYVESIPGTQFDFIYIDPPYEKLELYNQTIANIFKSKILKPTGLIIVETNDPDVIKIPEGLLIQKKKKYGKVFILYISNNI